MKSRINQISYTFVLPALILYCIFFICPSVQSFYYALTDWNGFNKEANFIGLENFFMLSDNTRYLASFENTVKYAFFTSIGQAALGLVLALLVNMGMRLTALYRAVFFAPQIISLLAVGYIWSYILAPTGALNLLLERVGLSVLTHNWLGSLNLALDSIIAFSIWNGAGFCMVVFLANLQGIPQELKEAAEIDGAGAWQKFWRVTFPLMIPSIMINMITGMIAGFKVYDVVKSTTEGGPGYATDTITTVMFDTAFVANRYGEGTAMGITMFVLILLVTIVQLAFFRRKEVEM